MRKMDTGAHGSILHIGIPLSWARNIHSLDREEAEHANVPSGETTELKLPHTQAEMETGAPVSQLGRALKGKKNDLGQGCPMELFALMGMFKVMLCSTVATGPVWLLST